MEESNPLNLLSMNMCSPMVVFTVFAVVIGVGIYMSRTALKRFNSNKMNNLYNYHTLQEVKLLIVLGATIYGLCQYNQVNLAWIFLIFPIIYLILRNVFVFIPISNAHQNTPKDVEYVQQAEHVQQVQQGSSHQQYVQQQQEKHQLNPLNNSSNSEIGMSPPLNSGSSISGLDKFNGGGGGVPF